MQNTTIEIFNTTYAQRDGALGGNSQTQGAAFIADDSLLHPRSRERPPDPLLSRAVVCMSCPKQITAQEATTGLRACCKTNPVVERCSLPKLCKEREREG